MELVEEWFLALKVMIIFYMKINPEKNQRWEASIKDLINPVLVNDLAQILSLHDSPGYL